MKRKSIVIILGFMFCFVLPSTVHSCVGRLLTIAISNSPDQVIMGQMLSILINERTGTSVEVIQYGDVNMCHEKVLSGKANIYINYIGMGWAGTGGSGKLDDPQKVYTLVSQLYNEKFGMIWLKPFGFSGPFSLDARVNKESVTLAAPVATKDVLRKFPVLDRVINKLGGRIDNHTMDELKEKSEKQGVIEVVREFLRTQRLI